jgi:hypothetical protein
MQVLVFIVPPSAGLKVLVIAEAERQVSHRSAPSDLTYDYTCNQSAVRLEISDRRWRSHATQRVRKFQTLREATRTWKPISLFAAFALQRCRLHNTAKSNSFKPLVDLLLCVSFFPHYNIISHIKRRHPRFTQP